MLTHSNVASWHIGGGADVAVQLSLRGKVGGVKEAQILDKLLGMEGRGGGGSRRVSSPAEVRALLGAVAARHSTKSELFTPANPGAAASP